MELILSRQIYEAKLQIIIMILQDRLMFQYIFDKSMNLWYDSNVSLPSRSIFLKIRPLAWKKCLGVLAHGTWDRVLASGVMRCFVVVLMELESNICIKMLRLSRYFGQYSRHHDHMCLTFLPPFSLPLRSPSMPFTACCHSSCCLLFISWRNAWSIDVKVESWNGWNGALGSYKITQTYW